MVDLESASGDLHKSIEGIPVSLFGGTVRKTKAGKTIYRIALLSPNDIFSSLSALF